LPLEELLLTLLVEEPLCRVAVPFCLPLLGSGTMSLLPPEAFFFSYAVSNHCSVFSFPSILLTTTLWLSFSNTMRFVQCLGYFHLINDGLQVSYNARMFGKDVFQTSLGISPSYIYVTNILVV